MIIFGGGGSFKKRYNDLYSYDFSLNKWDKLYIKSSQNPTERTYHASQIYKNYLVLFGGDN